MRSYMKDSVGVNYTTLLPYKVTITVSMLIIAKHPVMMFLFLNVR